MRASLHREALVFCALLSFSLAAPLGAVEVLGVGTEFLLGGDLTDIDSDGLEDLYSPPDELAGFDAIFFASDEEGFQGGESAFNVFDNILGPGNDKWCCGTVFPQIVGADFRETTGNAYRLTQFTVSSANDVPERDPVVWRIEGSNDGECWFTIFSEDDLVAAVEAVGRSPGQAIWTDRLEVIRFEEGNDYAEQTDAYSMFRMATFSTALTTGAFFQVGEIEFFGEEGEPPAGPVECPTCSTRVATLTCTVDADSIDLSWEIPDACNCKSLETSIVAGGVEIASVAADATSVSIPLAELPGGASTIEVRNCSGISATCAPFLTDANGYIIGSAWLVLGPFATPVACDGTPGSLLTNQIGPQESIACQYPIANDPVEGYVPGDPFFPDPETASTSGYHLSAPTDDDGNPIWVDFQDLSPHDADLDFDQVVVDVSQHVMFTATWIENTSGSPLELQACFGSDDDGQIWLDDEAIHNNAACRGRALCQDIVFFALPPGVHVIKLGVFEEGGGFGGSLGLVDPATQQPIIDLGGVLDVDDLPNASPLSADIVFHGRERPAGFVVPECKDAAQCFPVTDLTCTREEDGSIELTWENPPDCPDDIEIRSGDEVLATLDSTATSHTIAPQANLFIHSITVDNGGFDIARCTLVEVLPALLGSDLTDVDDDGLELNYLPPEDLGGFDAEFFSSDEPSFGAGESAFNVFDNVVGGGDDKWCCGTVFPQIVGADFTNSTGTAYRLTHFTVAAANDTPDRDPRVWSIEGSNDGKTWETIFSQNDPTTSLWAQRLEVLLFEEGRDYPEQDTAYSMFRMVTEQTGLVGGAFFQIGEIEFFGEEGGGPVAPEFVRGDADASGGINITDGVFVLNFLFQGGGDPPCKDAADADDSGGINITDGVYVLNFLFQGGPDPAAPYPDCGVDPAEDTVDCVTGHPSCV